MVLCKDCWNSMEIDGLLICCLDYFGYDADDDRPCDGFIQKGKGCLVEMDANHTKE